MTISNFRLLASLSTPVSPLSAGDARIAVDLDHIPTTLLPPPPNRIQTFHANLNT
jgi:hypothetical protein